MVVFIEVLIVLLLGIPSLFFSIQLILGIKRSKCLVVKSLLKRKPCTILIPAHNEAEIIADTLIKLKQHIGTDDRVLVIADNCNDATAEIALCYGVDVLVRNNIQLCGKGYALDAGLTEARKYLPETIVIFDADCQFEGGALDRIVSLSQRTDSVVQGQYLMKAPVGASVKSRIAEFAWFLKNSIRPMGQKKLGLGCQLHGTGMAFPLKVFDHVSLASGSIVEDLELGLNLRKIGYNPIFEPSAIITSEFPVCDHAISTQRTRWEHGHMATSILLLPRLLTAIFKLKLPTFLMIIDAMIPPTVLWLMINTLVSCVLAAASLFFDLQLFYLILTLYFLQIFSIWLVWFIRGREIIPASNILGIFAYVFDKFSIYKKFVSKREKEWIKTNRK